MQNCCCTSENWSLRAAFIELKLAKGKDKAGASGFKYNEIKSIPTVDGLVRPRDVFICISLTNSSFLGRSYRLEG
jgi:hypothetical protein